MGSPDLEAVPSLHTPILGSRPPPRRTLRLISLALFLASLLALASFLHKSGSGTDPIRSSDSVVDEYAWNNRMLTWQRAGFHFRTIKNFLNDPSAPMYYKGWYHLFYQHNPKSPYWDNIVWGHAVSHDLINWFHLPVAIGPDRWYDIYGTWTGSITVVSDDRVVMMYTGGTADQSQNMNIAVAVDPSDPLLIKWIKCDEVNPVLWPPPSIGRIDFRDPNPIWYNTSDSTWQIMIGTKNDSLDHTGIAIVYTTKDFLSFTLLPGIVHSVDKIVGMWECIDLFPVASAGPLVDRGLDNSMMLEENVKHVLKSSLENGWHDYYAIGTYDPATHTWVPDDETFDMGIGWRYDWGKFYASITFYDPVKQRRVLWGYVGEKDSRSADIQKGWASFMGIPRTILFDAKTGINLLTWPVEEVESLRMDSKNFSNIVVNKGSTVELDIVDANQLDIEVEFEIQKEALEDAILDDVGYNCSSSGGAVNRGAFGPFGLLVFANRDLTEQTAIYFYVSRGTDGSFHTHLCQDEMRSSKANDILKWIVGSTFPVLDGEMLSLRILVDHSIVESFAQGGRMSMTSRVYPTEAIYEEARVFLFNNATAATVTAKTVKIWHMNSTINQVYQFPSSPAK